MKTNQFTKKTIGTVMIAAAMLLGTSSTFAQVKIGNNPTIIGTSNNLEVESSTGMKTSIHKTSGKVTIKDGSEGLSRVLTSDANGVATWQAPIPTTNLYVDAYTVTQQDVPSSNVNGGYTKLNMELERADRSNNYDPATSEITIPSDGIYLIYAGTSKWTVTTGGICVSLNLTVNGLGVELLDGGTGCNVANDGPYHMRGNATIFLKGNDKVSLSLRNLPSSGGFTGSIGFDYSFLRMVKLSN